MLDALTKRRIDSARDILVGKVPDPKSQVEQITIALIYKFMNDMDLHLEELGGRRTFFAGEFARYSWPKLVRSGLGGHDVLNLYAEAVGKMPENPGIPPLFRDIFKNAYLPYRDPETLRAFLKVIDEFEYDHSEKLGDAFEYLLSVLGSQGDAGQFRTPRHIIEFVVGLVKPTKADVILDPACGTAGFLISAWKYILKDNTDQLGSCQLTPEELERVANNVRGYDISPDMVRLSLANMYLHGFADPHVHEYDSLTSEERWSEYADVILANPPFMTPKGGISPHTRFSIKSRRSEVLFLDYILEHLSADGRAGVVVPEGIHFVAQSGHRALRETLIDKHYLVADITLPHGVFKPYASVKTHILIIDRRLARTSDSVLFVEIENDGFSQTDTREPIPGSQLELAAKCVEAFRAAVAAGEKWASPPAGIRAYCVEKSVLRANRQRHLLGRWNDLPNRVVHRPGLRIARLPASARPPITWPSLSSFNGERMISLTSCDVMSFTLSLPMLGLMRRSHMRRFWAAVLGLFSAATTSALYRSHSSRTVFSRRARRVASSRAALASSTGSRRAAISPLSFRASRRASSRLMSPNRPSVILLSRPFTDFCRMNTFEPAGVILTPRPCSMPSQRKPSFSAGAAFVIAD